MDGDKACCAGIQNGFEHQFQVDDRAAGAADAKLLTGENLVGAVEQQQPKLLVVKVGEQGGNHIERIATGADARAGAQVRQLPPSPELECGGDGDGLCFAHALEALQVFYAAFAEVVEVVINGGKDMLPKGNGAHAFHAGTDQYGNQFGIAQGGNALQEHLFTRSVFFGPPGDGLGLVLVGHILKVRDFFRLLTVDF